MTRSGDISILPRLYETIVSRKGDSPETSYTAKLLSRGTAKVTQKLGEEAVEVVIEGMRGDKAKLIGESADLIYHLLVLWADQGVDPEEVWATLEEREGISGLADQVSLGKKQPI